MPIMQPPLTGQWPGVPSAVHEVAMVGLAEFPMAVPSPDFHFNKCRIDPPLAAVRVSTNAALLPS
jgi:hypothetical protein